MPSLRFHLRQSTADAHRRLEACIDIEDNCRDLDRYRSLLAMFRGFYAPLERKLARIDWRDAELDFEGRAKLPWLDADLAALGLSPERIAALPQAGDLPPIDTVADAMGVLYVLEGSTLGGQTIVPLVSEGLGLTPGSGARFFASYGPEVGPMWRGYVAALDLFGADPASAARVEQGALAAFDSLIAWADERSRAHDAVEGRPHVG